MRQHGKKKREEELVTKERHYFASFGEKEVGDTKYRKRRGEGVAVVREQELRSENAKTETEFSLDND
jgi:hypothetical protein